MKVATLFGTRPEIVKMSSVIPLLDRDFKQVLIHSGQHYDYEMNQVFFENLKVRRPDYHLGVGSKSNLRQTAEIMNGLEKVFSKEKPDVVLVHGDTNTTLAGGLAASKKGLRLAHIEAGCRSYNRNMQEELNRVVVDHLSEILFAPTVNCKKNLLKEGIKDNVHVVGSTLVDACKKVAQAAEKNSKITSDLDLGEYALLTLHRAENVDRKENLSAIIDAVNEASKFVNIAFPMHPRTRDKIRKFNLSLGGNILAMKPLGYLDFIKLLRHSRVVLTDSGGVQEEACIMEVPCLTLRDETEWIESVQAGANKIVGTRKNSIVKAVKETLHQKRRVKCPYKGGASKKIVKILKRL